jgi:3-hydroxypropanoate dehydrogenase
MAEVLDGHALDQLFRSARTSRAWSQRPVSEQQLRELYELLRLGPTSANCSPARFVWLRSAEGKERLAARAIEGNRARILAAPLTVIIGYDLDFAEHMPKLVPGPSGLSYRDRFRADPALAQTIAFRNSSLQGGYLIVAARALGLDCGPMSGFDNAAVDTEFFAGTRIKSNFICGLGYSSGQNLQPRAPRLEFDEATRFA